MSTTALPPAHTARTQAILLIERLPHFDHVATSNTAATPRDRAYTDQIGNFKRADAAYGQDARPAEDHQV